MEYKIKLHPKADKFLNKLDKDISNRIVSRLRVLHNNPFHYLEHYASKDCYKFREGEYRALADVDLSRKLFL